jgi:predicted deacetylase
VHPPQPCAYPAQSYGNHVFIHAFAQADPGIKTPFNNIDKAVINHQLKINFRIFPEEGF